MKDEGGRMKTARLFILHPSYFILPIWSGRRDSNSRPSAWKADALPTELHPPETLPIVNFQLPIRKPSKQESNRQLAIENRQSLWCRGQDSNLRRALARRVYSPVPLTTRPPLHALSNGCWSRRRDLNPRPSDYKSDALPTELRRHATERNSAFRQNSDTNNRSLKRQAAGRTTSYSRGKRGW